MVLVVAAERYMHDSVSTDIASTRIDDGFYQADLRGAYSCSSGTYTRALTCPPPVCPLLTMQVADFCAPSYRGGEEVLILSYEAAQQHAALLKAAPPFALLVCDEAHRLKSSLQPYINPGCNPMWLGLQPRNPM